jgi:hypothetical protein
MPPTLADLVPIGRDGPDAWLLLPKGEEVRKGGEDMTQQFYLLRADLGVLYEDTHPLQVWAKHLEDPRYVKPLDVEHFDQVVRPAYQKSQEEGGDAQQSGTDKG